MAFRATHIFWSKFVFSVTIVFSCNKQYVVHSEKSIYIYMYGNGFQGDTYLSVQVCIFGDYIILSYNKQYVVQSKKCVYMYGNGFYGDTYLLVQVWIFSDYILFS